MKVPKPLKFKKPPKKPGRTKSGSSKPNQSTKMGSGGIPLSKRQAKKMNRADVKKHQAGRLAPISGAVAGIHLMNVDAQKSADTKYTEAYKKMMDK